MRSIFAHAISCIVFTQLNNRTCSIQSAVGWVRYNEEWQAEIASGQIAAHYAEERESNFAAVTKYRKAAFTASSTANHRLPHEVTLLRDQFFPKCIKCENSVYFELVRSAPDITLAPFKVALYALPKTTKKKISPSRCKYLAPRLSKVSSQRRNTVSAA